MVELSLRLTVDDTTREYRDIHVRVISRWSDCMTTEIFNEESSSWNFKKEGEETDEPEENPFPGDESSEFKQATWTHDLQPNLSSETELAEFNRVPGIYAIVLACKNKNFHMVSLAYLDCSALLLQGGSVSCRGPKRDGIVLDLKLDSPQELVPLSKSIPLEPLVLDISSFDSFPLDETTPLEDILGNAYIYGSFDFGGVCRKILTYPQGDQAKEKGLESSQVFRCGGDREDIEIPQAIVPVGFKTTILSGEIDILKFKESLTHSTFVLQLHTDDLCERVFSADHLASFNKIAAPAPPSSPPTEASPRESPRGKKGGKAAAAPATAEPSSLVQPRSEPFTDLDGMIVEWIDKALENSARIKSHGAMRFRLEHLLESASDKLLEFQKTRTGENIEDLNVVVTESIVATVKPTRPSQPPRWHMPADISLKAALQKTKSDRHADTMARSGLSTAASATGSDGAGGIITQSTNAGSKRGSKVRPVYELYKDCETVVNLTVELHRKYSHPTSVPDIVPPKRNPGAIDASESQSPRQTLEASSSFSSSALEKRLRVTPFARMVFVFKYDDDETLRRINSAVSAVNSRALPDIQGTLRSYSFSKQEVQLTNDAELDVVCGFMIIDDEMRLIVLEGLGGIGLGMQNVFADIPRLKGNDSSLKILCNPEVLFSKRMYTDFGPDLKRVRPRDKLRKLARKPEIYNRKQVDMECFEAIDKLMALKRCADLKTSKELECYPSAESINMLELLYGDALSKQDLDGSPPSAGIAGDGAVNTVTFQVEGGGSQSLARGEGLDGFSSAMSQSEFGSSVSPTGGGHGRSGRTSRLAPTDSHNPMFDEMIRTRDPNHPRYDRLKEQRDIRKAAWAQALNRMAAREEEDNAIIAKALGIRPDQTSHVKVHMYSGQRENITEKLAAVRRQELGATKNASFTNCKEYLSSSIALVDEEVDAKIEKVQERKKWTTQRGFQYPPPKKTKDLIAHPKKPSEARVEDLKEPFEQFDMDSDHSDPELRDMEKHFSSMTKPASLFGMLEPPQFSRPFELSRVGDRTRLPRGELVSGQHPNDKFWQSVHLCGDQSAQAQLEAAEAAKKAWHDRVVVDHLDMKVGGFNVKDRPSQLDRTADILKGEPKDISLKKIREMKTASGRDISYKSTPLTIMNTGEYVQNAQEKSLLRAEDKSKFITTYEQRQQSESGQVIGEDFTRYIHHGEGKPKQHIVLSKKKHRPVPPQEKVGPKWERYTSTTGGPTDFVSANKGHGSKK